MSPVGHRLQIAYFLAIDVGRREVLDGAPSIHGVEVYLLLIHFNAGTVPSCPGAVRCPCVSFYPFLCN
jgi:hypothetical protein